MKCLDSSALVDYLHGAGGMAAFLDANEGVPLCATTVSLHEVFVGAARLDGVAGVTDAREDLRWVQPLELSADGAAEAAVVRAELRESGTPIGAMDALIAGMARHVGATVVTRDDHFDAVEGLDVETY